MTEKTDKQEFIADFIKAQSEFPEIPKNRQGHGYKYADLADLINAVRPVLNANNLGFHQDVDTDESRVVTTIIHISGYERQFYEPIVSDTMGKMNLTQKQGSSETYAKRYGLSSACGVTAEEDTGGTDKAGRHKTSDDKITPDFRDPSNDGLGTGVKGAKVNVNMSPREKADAFADELVKKFKEAKTETGLSGEWDRNDKIIQRLDESYNDLYQNVLDAFTTSMESFFEPSREEETE